MAFDVEWTLNIQNQLISRDDTPTETWFCTVTLTGAVGSGALVVRQQDIYIYRVQGMDGMQGLDGMQGI